MSSGALTPGRRVQPNEHGWFNGTLEPGDYVRIAPVRAADGREFTAEERDAWWTKPYWICESPNGHGGSLANHTIVEHEDGTITVHPSIAIRHKKPGTHAEKYEDIVWEELWHGFLERGIWREC